MRKLLALTLALMLGILTGCNKKSDAIALRVWVGANEDLPWIEDVIARFKAAHPDKTYDIQVDIQNEGDASKRILNDVEAAADVFTFADDQFNSLYNAGALMPVQEDAERVIADNGGREAGAVVAALGTDGRLYAFPATADNGYFMFYNTEYFTPEDAESFDAMLNKAAARGKYVAFPMSNAWYFYSFFKGAGLDMHVTSDGVTNTCNWNATDTPITGVQVIEGILKITGHKGFREADSDAFVAGLKDGSIVAGVSGTWNADTAASLWGENYAAAKLPTYTVAGQQVQMASFAGYKLVGVSPYSKHVGEALDFVAFMTDEQSQMTRFQMRGQGPSNVKVAASEAVQASPAIAALAKQDQFAFVQRVGSKYWDPAAALGKILVNGNPDGTDPQQLLNTCVAGITAPGDL